jgi:hypothetical protein
VHFAATGVGADLRTRAVALVGDKQPIGQVLSAAEHDGAGIGGFGPVLGLRLAASGDEQSGEGE